jgi:hypothetical protein
MQPKAASPADLPLFSWRLATPQDLHECLQMCPLEAYGAETLGHDTLVQVWADMLTRSPATASAAVFEADRPVHGSRTVGFGCAAFVTEAFAEDAAGFPRPWLNKRFLQALHEGRSPILTPEELRRDNTIAGLNLLTLAGYIRPACEDDPRLLQEISIMISRSFQQWCAGFRLRRFFCEITHQFLRQRRYMVSAYRIHEYPQPRPASSPVGVVILDRDAALQYEELQFAQLFIHYREPRLRLTPAEQDLLKVALTGHPNPSQADELGVGMEAVRSRWRNVLHKATGLLSRIMPSASGRHVSGNSASAAKEGLPKGQNPRSASAAAARGPQRRQYLLNYVREHPEELRPFDWQLWDRIHGSESSEGK